MSTTESTSDSYPDANNGSAGLDVERAIVEGATSFFRTVLKDAVSGGSPKVDDRVATNEETGVFHDRREIPVDRPQIRIKSLSEAKTDGDDPCSHCFGRRDRATSVGRGP